MENSKVVGTLEGLHYTEEIWTAMSLEQMKHVLALAGGWLSSGVK